MTLEADKTRAALDVLHSRVSCGILTDPPPRGAVLDNIKRAALRAADHRLLRPWRFLVIEGEGRDHLGEIFVQASLSDGVDMSPQDREKLSAKTRRAPMIMVAIASCVEDDKVPEIEQVLSAGCAVQNMLNAAFAQGVGAMWRTGDMAYHSYVKSALGLIENERIVGFLYLGAVKTALKPVPEMDPEQYFRPWP